jgi:SAM-dependent MidA family methyltransferase
MQLSRRLQAHLSKGPLPFSSYMEFCLFDPEEGYYSRLTAMGAHGDFITAPECGPYLAHRIAHYFATQHGSGEAPVILELGAGTGRLAFDLLLKLEALDAVPEQYLILEKSTTLAALQKERLSALPSPLFAKVAWCQTLAPNSLNGMVLANEVLDALAVERFCIQASEVKRLGVALEGGRLTEVPLEESLLLPPALMHLVQDLGEGYRSEFCQGLPGFLHPILNAFKTGTALIIDYGYERERYYSRARTDGTLLAYSKHQLISPFAAPGQCDITAHVDFTFVAETCLAQGWTIESLKPQGQFLLEASDLLAHYPLSIDNYALRRLIDPRLMGEVFQVLEVQKHL